MVMTNRSADEQSQFSSNGVLIGGALGGAKIAAVDIPYHVLLTRDATKWKDTNMMKNFTINLQNSHKILMEQGGFYKKMMGGKGRAITAGLAIGIGAIAGGFLEGN